MEEPRRPIPVTLRFRAARVERRDLRRLITRCLETERAPDGAGVGVVLAGGRLVRRLNRRWRGRDATTDVLSFPYGEAPPLPSGVHLPESEAELRLLGEVLVSVPRCLEQAGARGVDPGVELVRLVTHGVLHVLGHDHELEAERRKMERREARIRRWAARAGLGPGLLSIRRAGRATRRAGSRSCR